MFALRMKCFRILNKIETYVFPHKTESMSHKNMRQNSDTTKIHLCLMFPYALRRDRCIIIIATMALSTLAVTCYDNSGNNFVALTWQHCMTFVYVIIVPPVPYIAFFKEKFLSKNGC